MKRHTYLPWIIWTERKRHWKEVVLMPQVPLLLNISTTLQPGRTVCHDPHTNVCHKKIIWCPWLSIFCVSHYCQRKTKSRSLESIKGLDSLNTECYGTADVMLLIWRLGRIAEADNGLPGFTALCARLLPYNEASKIGYLLFIPNSPTNPAVLKEEMTVGRR